LLLVFLALAGAILVVVVVQKALPDSAFGATGDTPTPLGAAVGVALQLLQVVVGGIAVAAATILLTDRLVGRATDPQGAYRQVRPRLGALVAAGLASTLLSVVLQKLLLPVAFFMQPLFYGPAIVAQVIALERMGFRSSLSRAGQLLHRDAARTFMTLFLISLGASLLIILSIGLATVPFSQTTSAASTVINILIQVLLLVSIVPFVAAAMLVAYLDLRARKENLGISELATERGRSA
jgi:hypothetical protein